MHATRVHSRPGLSLLFLSLSSGAQVGSLRDIAAHLRSLKSSPAFLANLMGMGGKVGSPGQAQVRRAPSPPGYMRA